MAAPSFVRLVWIVRSRAYAKHIVENDLQRQLPHGISLKVDIYVTSSENGADAPLLAMARTDHETEESESEEDSIHKERLRQTGIVNPAGVTIRYRSGRPSMSEVLEMSLDDLSVARGRLAVQTCGPASMMEDLRDALVHKYGIGKHSIWGNEVDLWEDGFVW